jgi:hypothetical protein
MIRMGGWSDLRWKKNWSIIDQFYNESKLNGSIPTKLYRWNSKNMSTLHLIKHDVNFIRRNLTNILRIYVKVLNMKIIHKI